MSAEKIKPVDARMFEQASTSDSHLRNLFTGNTGFLVEYFLNISCTISTTELKSAMNAPMHPER